MFFQCNLKSKSLFRSQLCAQKWILVWGRCVSMHVISHFYYCNYSSSSFFREIIMFSVFIFIGLLSFSAVRPYSRTISFEWNGSFEILYFFGLWIFLPCTYLYHGVFREVGVVVTAQSLFLLVSFSVYVEGEIENKWTIGQLFIFCCKLKWKMMLGKEKMVGGDQ